MGFIAESSLFGQVINGVDYSGRSHLNETFDLTQTDEVGQRFASEHLSYKDEVTGFEVTSLTTARYSNSTFYQTHPSWTPDEKYIVFRSNRLGSGHAYAVSLEDFEIVQVTGGDDGSNLHLGWDTNVAYHFRGNQLIELDLGTLLADSENGSVGDPSAYDRVVTELPEDLNPSGDFALDANEERLFFISRMDRESSTFYVVDLESGEVQKLLEVPFWANHLQANRWVSGEMIYSWETRGDNFDGEIYRINLETGENTLLTTGHRPSGNGPFTGDAHSHHSISPDGKWLLFNSSYYTGNDIMILPLHPENEDK